MEDQIKALEAECEALRRAAHEAPMNIYHLDHDGHRWVEIVSYAWRDAGEAWFKASEKLRELREANKNEGSGMR